MIETVSYTAPYLMILNQSLLPGRVVYEKCLSAEDVAEAIRSLKVRGAPLIGVCAAFGLAMAVEQYDGPDTSIEEYFKEKKALLAATRPTAVNLFWALERMEKVFLSFAGREASAIARELLKEAQLMVKEDIAINQSIGKWGQTLLPPSCRVLTICNAGALATCGYGTALGIIRAAFAAGKLTRVWACETRPVLQGSRLTVWELMQDKIPVTLITDSMAGYTMHLGRVDAVIVGADRIAANGDTANKIGTYALAVLAKHHNIPFYVAAPLSTIDMKVQSGAEIPIEERHDDEVKYLHGACLSVPDVPVFNPAFDVTPSHLVSAIICEKGIIRPPYPEQLHGLFKREAG